MNETLEEVFILRYKRNFNQIDWSIRVYSSHTKYQEAITSGEMDEYVIGPLEKLKIDLPNGNFMKHSKYIYEMALGAYLNVMDKEVPQHTMERDWEKIPDSAFKKAFSAAVDLVISKYEPKSSDDPRLNPIGRAQGEESYKRGDPGHPDNEMGI